LYLLGHATLNTYTHRYANELKHVLGTTKILKLVVPAFAPDSRTPYPDPYPCAYVHVFVAARQPWFRPSASTGVAARVGAGEDPTQYNADVSSLHRARPVEGTQHHTSNNNTRIRIRIRIRTHPTTHTHTHTHSPSLALPYHHAIY
jgi:hypothetical protein